MNETLVRVLCREIESLNYSVEYYKKKAEDAEKELEEVHKKLDELTF